MTRFVRHAISEVIEVIPQKFGDHRGFFSETWQRERFAAEGIANEWIQDNHSRSAEPGTVRGLHFQAPPTAQAKLVRVVRGAIFDVAVDLRRGSPSYGQWVGVELSAEKWNQLLVPAGFAHGFMTIEPDSEVLYKVDAPWSRDDERALRWDDPDIGIEWPQIGVEPILSEKDAAAPGFAGFASPFA
jgi:dTDP-4-dehydrorhamnose 3,5-epimerase